MWASPPREPPESLRSRLKGSPQGDAFSRDSKPLNACSFEVKADKKSALAGSYKILVTDLDPGRWTVKSAGRTLGTFEVSPESGTLYFDAPAGLFELAKE